LDNHPFPSVKNQLASAVILPSLLLAIGIAAAGFFVSKMHYNAKVAINTAEAKGLAERRVKADRANWRVSLSVTGKSRDEIANLYSEAEKNQQAIVDVLTKGGLKEEEIDIGVISYSMREYRDSAQTVVDEKHTLSSSVGVETTNIEIIKPLRAEVNKLLAEGINLTNNAPSYHFTKMNDIKPEMLKEATRNAQIAAGEFAESVGSKVGRIRSARQGAFTVVDVGSTHGDTRALQKDVRVVITVSFYLTD
jgi:hypothetical protein